MEKTSKHNVEKDLRILVSQLLRIGVLIAAAVTLTGGILFFIQHPDSDFTYRTFISEPARLRQVHIILKEAFAFRSRAVIQLGILLLIAVPVLRVLISLIGFAIEKNWVYILITGMVLAILLVSLFG